MSRYHVIIRLGVSEVKNCVSKLLATSRVPCVGGTKTVARANQRTATVIAKITAAGGSRGEIC